jgi:hypothetical protein
MVNIHTVAGNVQKGKVKGLHNYYTFSRLILCSEELATGPCPQPDEPNPQLLVQMDSSKEKRESYVHAENLHHILRCILTFRNT